MKKPCFSCVVVLAVFICSSASVYAVPKWLSSSEKVYPSARYLRAVGEGASLKQAQNAAVSALALSFNTKIKSRTEAMKNMALIQKDNDEFFSAQSFSQVVNVESDAEFLCSKFDEPYFDKKNQKFYAIAFIDRQEAFGIYKERITHLMNLIKKLYGQAASDSDTFRSVSACQKALSLSELAKLYIQNSSVLIPSESERYRDDYELMEKTAELLLQKRSHMSFSLVSNDSRCTPLENHLASLLEEKGFCITDKEPEYCIEIKVDFSEEHMQAGEFVRPSIRIQMKNSENISVKSYSKSYPRYGAKSMDMAYTRSILKIQEDLAENFLSDF